MKFKAPVTQQRALPGITIVDEPGACPYCGDRDKIAWGSDDGLGNLGGECLCGNRIIEWASGHYEWLGG